jgi:hypothetical protein
MKNGVTFMTPSNVSIKVAGTDAAKVSLRDKANEAYASGQDDFRYEVADVRRVWESKSPKFRRENPE